MGLDLIPLNFPLGCGPGSDPPQFPPWVWAWRGVSLVMEGASWGVSLVGGCLLGGCLLLGGLLGRKVPPSGWHGEAAFPGDPPVNRMTNRCKNITLPQTSFAVGKNVLHIGSIMGYSDRALTGLGAGPGKIGSLYIMPNLHTATYLCGTWICTYTLEFYQFRSHSHISSV